MAVKTSMLETLAGGAHAAAQYCSYSWGPSRLEYGPMCEKKVDMGCNEKGEIQCHGKLDMQEATEVAVQTLGP